MISLDTVYKTYQAGNEHSARRGGVGSGGVAVPAVQRVSLDIAAGQLVTIYGVSGSGKTTLINMIAGLDDPDSGTVNVAGIEVTALSTDQRAAFRRESVGVVFQEYNLIANATVADNVSLAQVAGGMRRSAAKRAAEEALRRVGLDGLGGRFPQQLSSGQKQRVGVARALLGARKVLLVDEPTGALDAVNSLALFALFRELADDGMTVLVATHDPLARGYADRVFSIADGKVVEELRIEKLRFEEFER
ncbi:ABC transporter ATP-binding protein [Rhodococcus sp. ARC_M6]|uniref:ABC transporter ATP-binding protein n=1 Tax=Rhodococcus sp. ARC_M6 TaxID=2928852 RepID=UPI001FB1F50D|nr:ABC transporter ATP-binding protein [Rhodococcus sp. ARC_M6]MCJ0905314.1 ABC transporter ATP-binding protein [Rhodococcus sp. ARC_M6]